MPLTNKKLSEIPHSPSLHNCVENYPESEFSPAVIALNLSKGFTHRISPLARLTEALFRKEWGNFNTIKAVSDLSLTVNKGETVGIVGMNGSGKTTLLQILSGIIRPTSGTLVVNGRISTLFELATGFNPDLSGRQNIYIYGAIMGMSRQEMDDRFSHIVAFSDLGDFIDQPVRTYSTGMYVRLAFSLAINVRPDILIIDEFLSVGDVLFQAKCFGKLREFQQQGMTIIFSTHTIPLLSRLCNKACLLHRGELLLFDTPQAVSELYRKIIGNNGQIDERLVPTSNDRHHPPATGESECNLMPRKIGYGNSKATLLDIKILDRNGEPQSHLVANREYEFRVHIAFHDRIENPIIAYRIQSESGLDICGTNTLYQTVDTAIYEGGDQIIVSFCQRVSLRVGEYFLSASCAGFENGHYMVYDRRYNAVPFSIMSHTPSEGVIDLEASITLSREHGVPL